MNENKTLDDIIEELDSIKKEIEYLKLDEFNWRRKRIIDNLKNMIELLKEEKNNERG